MLSRSNIGQYVKYIELLFYWLKFKHTLLFFLQVLQDSTLRTHCMFHLYLSTCDMKHFIGVYVHIFKV